MNVPKITFCFIFSFRKSIEKSNRTTGPLDRIMGALILAVSWSPKKRRVIGSVTPTSDNVIRYGTSSRAIFKRWMTKGKSTSPPTKSRKKENVNGTMSSSDHLKIGNAAPQIIFAIISASIARWYFEIFMGREDAIS